MTTRALLLLGWFAAGPAAAHDYPIKPASVVLRVEPDRIAADVDSDSIYWIEKVVGNLHPMPPRDWPADALARTEKYVNAHLRLSVDGRRLEGRLLDAAYTQRPWEVNEQGRFRLRLVYPPLPDGAALTGAADFFADYREERLEEREEILPSMDFRTFLNVPGRVPHAFVLAQGADSFSVSSSDARRGASARALESLGVGASVALASIAGWAALAGLALSLGPGAPSRARAGVLLAAALLGAAPWPFTPQAWLFWGAGLAAALSCGRWLGSAAAPWLEAAALAALLRAWSAAAVVRLPRASPGALEFGACAAGLLAVAASALFAGRLAVDAERRGLTVLSESRAPELFERRRRLAATVLFLACGYGLFQSLPR